MIDYKVEYERLRNEYERYQHHVENQIQVLNRKNIKLERNIDTLSSIVEISKYINSYFGNKNLTTMINDMLIGILGVNFSTIFLKEKGKLVVKSSNILEENIEYNEYIWKKIKTGKTFRINSKKSIFPKNKNRSDVCSILGTPIKIRDEFIGYIVVEHTHFDFFTAEHERFIGLIGNQIAICLENSSLYNMIQEAAKRDPLLDTYNRKYFFDVVASRLKNNPENSFAIVMVDLDNFKSVNDTLGHQFGDHTLMSIAMLLEQNLKKDEILARYGGEEIVMYVSNYDNPKEVIERVDNIRSQIEKKKIVYRGKEKSITASFGISFYPEDENNIEKILDIADKMLYKAKNLGKNKVVVSKDIEK